MQTEERKEENIKTQTDRTKDSMSSQLSGIERMLDNNRMQMRKIEWVHMEGNIHNDTSK